MKESYHLETMLTSDSVHNRNCHAYLLQLKFVITPDCIDLKPSLFTPLQQVTEHYDQRFAYGNLYTYLLSNLEEHLDCLYIGATPKQSKDLDKLALAIYHNDNHILGLEQTQWINSINKLTRPTQSNTSGIISSQLIDNGRQVNTITPNAMGSLFHLTLSFFSFNFKPQLGTNLPSLKNYEYRVNEAPTEYRFSTQAQIHHGQIRVSPLFIRWLTIKAEQSSTDKSICHVYFNSLSLEYSNFDIAGIKERALSLTLHELNLCKNLKIAVITLPASKSLMSSEHYNITADKLDYSSVFNELYQVTLGNSHPSGIADFYINSEIRQKLFGPNQADILQQLLRNSFAAHGIQTSNQLSTAQKQAVWLHFNKFELTQYIIKTLNPDSYNFSCKDAIDRGNVSSLYYNLFQSFQSTKPMQKDEFERVLDAPAANVKGRGMNFQRKILWNALDSYVNANYDELIKDNKKSWLIFWRDMNCPHSRVNGLLGIRLIQCRKEIDALPPKQLREVGLTLISNVESQYQEKISGQRLMLELVSRTSQLLMKKNATQQEINAYKQLIQELTIKTPYLQLIAGLAKMFIGLLLFIPSLGYSQTLVNSGLASAKASFFVSQRKQMGEDILRFSAEVQKVTSHN